MRREALDDIFPGDLGDGEPPRRAASEQSASGKDPRSDTPILAATPYAYRDPRQIPPREWIYGRFLCRRYVSAIISPGGVGKSTLVATDAVAMAKGAPLLADKPHAPLKVWLWNGEDPAEETERRVAACILGHGIDPADVEGRLFIDSGRETPIKIASSGKLGATVATPIVEALTETIRANGIDVLIVDPFVSAHDVVENDNGAVDAAVKAFALIAHRTNAAALLVHHSRKLNGGEADIDSARGGSAIAAAVRSARVLNVMSQDAAKKMGISESERRLHVRIDDAKANLAPSTAAKWFRLTSVSLGNETPERPADAVAVAEFWTPPDPLAGLPADAIETVRDAVAGQGLRENAQADDWVGHAIGKALGLNSKAEPDLTTIKSAIKIWLASGALIRRTERIGGKDRPTIDIGEASE